MRRFILSSRLFKSSPLFKSNNDIHLFSTQIDPNSTPQIDHKIDENLKRRLDINIRDKYTESGTKKSLKLRANGEISGIVYGKRKDGLTLNTRIKIKSTEFEKQLRLRGAAIENTLYQVVIDNVEYNVLPRQIQFHPCK